MLSILFAAISAALLMIYWVFCRRISLTHRRKAAVMLEEFFADENELESEKSTIYWTYKWTRHWFFMPLMVLVAPFAMVFMVVKGDRPSDTGKSKRYDEIMDSLITMYMTRNPATSIVCAAPIVITFAIAVIVGLMLNRLKTIPSLLMVYSSVADKASHGSRSVQVH